jgi:hypothetical protein
MADKLDLTSRDIPTAIDDAAVRSRQIAVAYVDADGAPSLSFRGSVHVHGPDQVAIWARKRDSGLAVAIEKEPRVALLYFGGSDPGPRFVSIKGRAHTDEAQNDKVYDEMIEGERGQDPERKGIAVIVDVDHVFGFGADGPFEMAR